jgi:hypothetical protein
LEHNKTGSSSNIFLSRNTVTPPYFIANGKIRFELPKKTDSWDLNFNGFGFHYCALFPFKALAESLIETLAKNIFLTGISMGYDIANFFCENSGHPAPT